MSPLSPHAVRFGIVSGVLLYADAFLRNSTALPLLWPLIGGAVALWLAARRAPERPSAVSALRIGASVGLIAAAVAVAAAFPTYLLLSSPAGVPLARALGSVGTVPWSPRALETLGLALVLAIPAALIGSVASRPFVRPSMA